MATQTKVVGIFREIFQYRGEMARTYFHVLKGLLFSFLLSSPKIFSAFTDLGPIVRSIFLQRKP